MTHVLNRVPGRFRRPPGTAALEAAVGRPRLLVLDDAELACLLRDPQRCDDAREALVWRYQFLVRSSARRYQLPVQYYEDLIQV